MTEPHRPASESPGQQDAEALALSVALLEDFAVETGVTSDRPPRRYLWTDAFAVCGFVGLYTNTGQQRFLDVALRLVDQVHHSLGRHRSDDPRTGWISGLDEHDGEEHPTASGLRIGKDEPERQPGEAYDARHEWDRDGQYYHYLTRWMHALNRVWRVTGEPRYHRWAAELAGAAHRGFVRRADSFGTPWIAWKMSIDLSRPLVPTSGQHDPLDGRIVVETLRATAPEPAGPAAAMLDSEAYELGALCRGRSWATDDPLGLGGLLTDCLRLVQLRMLEHPIDEQIEAAVLGDAQHGLEAYAETAPLQQPAHERLAFRELGLAVGLRAAGRLVQQHDLATGPSPHQNWVESVRRNLPLAPIIEQFWTRPENRDAPTWTDHRHINAVMLATALTSAGYLDL